MAIIKFEDLTKEKLHQEVIKNNGKARKRILGEQEVNRFLEELKSIPQETSLVVYSNDGFVANSYGSRADIAGIRYNYTTKNIQVSWYPAKRNYGKGKLIDKKKYNYGF